MLVQIGLRRTQRWTIVLNVLFVDGVEAGVMVSGSSVGKRLRIMAHSLLTMIKRNRSFQSLKIDQDKLIEFERMEMAACCGVDVQEMAMWRQPAAASSRRMAPTHGSTRSGRGRGLVGVRQQA